MTCYFCNLNKDINIENKKQYNFDISKNYLIKGDNLDILNAMQNVYKNKIKLIYIDPPYNTKVKRNYKDRFTHQEYLDFMYSRLALARELLSDDGVIFVQIDDNEQAYLKVLMDEIFGRDNFINNIVWKSKLGNSGSKKILSRVHEYLLLYQKSSRSIINIIKEKNTKKAKQYIEERFNRKDISGIHKDRLWAPYPLENPGKKTPNLMYSFLDRASPKKGWRMVKEKLEKLHIDEKLYIPECKNQNIVEKRFLDEYEGQPITSIFDDVSMINPMSKERLSFLGQKPESLLKRIIQIGSNEGDIVLDFFAGSGTTPAVAHKMNRRWIAVEQMDYIENITKERLKKVINGEQGGISKDVSWQGGGEFIYFDFNLL
jgi:adenine-specific DNA-methyltransferase